MSLVIAIVAIISVAVPAQAKINPAISGTSCSVAGTSRIVKNISYVCTASEKKKIWRKGSTTTAAPTTECDIRTTASGKASGTNELMPGGNRVKAAVSADGVTWTRSADAIVDQVGTPSLVLSPKGLPLLYTTAHQINGRQDGFAVSIGTADGRSWRHCKVKLIGFPPGFLGVDPDVVALPSGGYRMYLTGTATQGVTRVAIYYADSTDGVTWTYGGLAFESSESILDSVTFRVGSTWHMYVLSGTSTDMVHGTSADGRMFTQVGKGPVLLNGKNVVLSQAIVIGGQLRVFCFAPPGDWIRSFITADGSTWQTDSKVALTFDSSIEYKFIRDPAVVQLTNGTYLMVYATAIP